MMDVPLFLFGLTSGVAIVSTVQYLVHTAKKLRTRNAVAPHKIEESSDALVSSPTTTSSPTPVTPPGSDFDMGTFTARAMYGEPASRKPSYSVPSFVAGDGTLPRLERELTVSSQKLHRMVRHLVNEMRKGLEADGHTLKMIPSYVVARPKGNEVGSYLALDFGGSNFRVCMVELRGNGQTRVRQSKHVIPDHLKKGTGGALFDFFAECIGKFLEDIGEDPKAPRSIGFTFSFPVQQEAINHGALMHWNKGFEATGVVNQDVVALLNTSLQKADYNLTVTALVNDTVGTLVAHAYQDPQTYIGVILGTGTNAAYVERIADIPKWNRSGHGAVEAGGEMVINTEWGAYDEASVLPLTSWDHQLDRGSENPRKQTFEKMISGMYLGEIVRYILIDLISTGELFKGVSSKPLQTPYLFETAYMSRIERDHSLELSDTKTVLEDLMQVPVTTAQDRRTVKHVCELVGIRAARLSAAGVAAIITKMKRFDACTVAIDGSVFEHYPHFANRMRDALRELLGIMAENIVLEQVRCTSRLRHTVG
ncbi:uncharacterized protein EV422DRAFT_23458 [Fimicolochytrium jonesii]|uniref:uncharacterized protein n=1 Tax=Fimicolochytrium jonesii TaxID=1396493 RepID=UPI0022FF3EB1|nr:uncharacterized protein EV422DRAFT_23458 [Fimicolochytrium jonesii]KAI8827045.1 hypothetical protein EV422DRAFT_23458 [Fimicolochytrium jonesii]